MTTTSEKSTQYFSRACSLLSKMVKEKAPNPVTEGLAYGARGPPTTMDLLPKIDAAAADDTRRSEEDSSERSQLTIFYGGSVFVFDDFAAEGAKDLMQMAAAVGSAGDAPAGADRALESGGLRITDLLVQTRRASLDRFLCKRRERINASAPYRVRGSLAKMGAMAKPEEALSWLGLGNEISKLSTVISGSM